MKEDKIVFQVNGKVCSETKMAPGSSSDKAVQQAMEAMWRSKNSLLAKKKTRLTKDFRL